MAKETLFNVEEIEIDPKYISPKEKRKWNKEFKKWIIEEYEKKSGKEYGVHCGDRYYCDLCELRHMNACSDCLISLKEYCKLKGIEIDYRDFDFEKLIRRIENEN